MGQPVTITPDQTSSGPVTITPDSQQQSGMLSQAWGAVKDRVGSMAQHLSESPTANAIYDVSAPGIATEYYKKFSGQPNEVGKLPQKLATTALPMMVGEPEAAMGEEAASARPPAPIAATEGQGSGVLSRVMEVAKRRAGNLPGVKAVKDLNYVVRGGGEEAPAAAPEPPAPSVPEFWGKGQYGTPVDQWGSRVAEPGQAGQLAQSMKKPPAEVAPGFNRGALGDLLNKSLGAEESKVQPGKPIYQRSAGPPSGAISGADLPEGHTAHQSSAIPSSMYDSGAKEFHARMVSGNTSYVYGDVSPEEAQAFTDAESKGKAFQQIKNGHPLVAKIVNGKRLPVKASQ